MVTEMNNFDKSTSGINLEMTAFYDIGLSHLEFNDNFQRLENGLLQFIDYGNFEQIDSLADGDLYKITKSGLIKILKEDPHLWNDCREYLSQSPYKANKGDLLDFIQQDMQQDDLIDLLQDNFITLYDVVTVTGYSQGDRVDVVFLHRDQKEYNYKDKRDFLRTMADHFESLIYRCPAFVRLDVDGVEWDLSEYLDDVYYYDKDQIIDGFKQAYDGVDPEYVIKWLDDNLPEWLDYV